MSKSWREKRNWHDEDQGYREKNKNFRKKRKKREFVEPDVNSEPEAIESDEHTTTIIR